jgi:hypothetical protein
MGAQGPPPEVVRALAKLEALAFRAGALVGLGAYLAAYLVTLGLVELAESQLGLNAPLSDAGQLLFNAAFVPTERPVPAGGANGFSPAFNRLLDEPQVSALELPTVVYHAIPVVALLLGGVALAWLVDARGPRAGAIAGVSLVVGGVLFAITGTLVFESVEGEPPFLESVLLVGLVYPAVCGGLGGALGTIIRPRDAAANDGG